MRGRGALGLSVEGVAARAGPGARSFRSPCSPRLRRVCVPLPLGPVSPSPSPLRGRCGAAGGRPPRLRRGERAWRSASRDPGPPRARALTPCGAEKAKRSSRHSNPKVPARWRSGGRGGGVKWGCIGSVYLLEREALSRSLPERCREKVITCSSRWLGCGQTLERLFTA